MSSSVEQIKERLNIVDVVSSYIKLEKAGAANFKATCPFHSEKTPSFFVSPTRQTFHCFGCNAGGDMFTFVEEIEGVDFMGALKVLAGMAGVTLTKTNSKARTHRDGLFRLTDAATSFFEKNLKESKNAKEYLKIRGINEETIKEFRIGFAKNEWRDFFDKFTQKKIPQKALEQVGLIRKSEKGYYDWFRGRIMFPIADSSGRVAGFSGRILPVYEDKTKNVQAKYINSPETALFDKSRILHGFDKAKLAIRKNGMCVLVEGQLDLIMSHQAGVAYSVSVSGTALSVEHLQLIKRLTDKIVFAFDADQAGVFAAKRGIDIALAQGFDVRVAAIPEGLDPADLIKKDPEEWVALIKKSIHIIDFLINTALSHKKDPERIHLEVSSMVLPYIANITNNMEQAHFVRSVAEKLNIKESAVWKELDKLKTKNNTQRESTQKENLLKNNNTNKLKDKIKEKILGILIWQKGLEKPDINHIEHEKQFKKITNEDGLTIVKAKSISKERISELVFEAEMYYKNALNLELEIKELLVNLEKEILKEAFEEAMIFLKEAEKGNDETEVVVALEKCHNISKKLEKIVNK